MGHDTNSTDGSNGSKSSDSNGMGLRIASLALPATGFDAFTFPRYRPLLSDTTQPEAAAERIDVGVWLGGTSCRPVRLVRPARA